MTQRRVYFAHRGVAHLMDVSVSLNSFPYTPAFCGACPTWPGAWFGEGSQDEYDEASRRRTCFRCWCHENPPPPDPEQGAP